MSQQSFHQQTATGADINFTITTFSSDEILVYVDGVLKSAGSDYNINPYNANGQSTVDWIGTAPSSPSVVRVVRQTDVLNNGNTAVEGRATFQAGSSVKADDLNNNTKQVLRAIQELQDQKIQGYDIEDNSITTVQIADNTITTDNIANGTIVNADINASADIAVDKLANGTARQLLQTNAGGNGVEFTSNVDVPGTLDVTNAATFDSTVTIGGAVTVNNTTTLDDTTVDGVLDVNGSATIDDITIDGSSITDSGDLDINAPTINLDGNLRARPNGVGIRFAVDDTVVQTFVNFEPYSNNQYDLGSSSKQFKDLYIDGTANIDSLVADAANINGATTLDNTTIDGALDLNGNLDVDGTTNLDATNVVGPLDVTGNILVSGNVDGRDVAADGTKLDGIESGATADQTNAEIRAAVDAASDSNVFTDADHTKLDGIETGATADQTNAEIKTAYEANSNTNAFTDAEQTKLGNAVTLTDAQTLTNKTLTTPVINDFSGTAIVTSGTSTSDNKVYSAKRSDELYTTQASQAATSATQSANSATASANSATAAANSATASASSATASAASATTAANQASTAGTHAATALTHLNTFKGQYLGALSSNPVTDSLGNAIDVGDLYFNTTDENIKIFNGSTFQGIDEVSLEVSNLANADFSALYTASAGSNSINLGGLAVSGAVFSNENISSTRVSLAKGSTNYNLGGI